MRQTSRLALISVLGAWYVLALGAWAYPSRHTCSNFLSWTPGQLCNGDGNCMGFSTLSNGAGGNCLLDAPLVYKPCDLYLIRISSNEPRGHKVAVSAGELSAIGVSRYRSTGSSITCRQTPDGMQTTESRYFWRAPPTNISAIGFSALCGDETGGIFAAPRIPAKLNESVTEFYPNGCPDDCSGPACGDDSSPSSSEITHVSDAVLGLAVSCAISMLIMQ